MTERTQEDVINKDLSSGVILQPSLSNSETYRYDAVSSPEENDETFEQEGEEMNLNPREDEFSLEEHPRGRPGAYAMPGDQESLSFASSESSTQAEEDLAAPTDIVPVPQLSAQLVDEAAEELRHREDEQHLQELEHRRQHNRELESQIHQMQSGAVLALSVTVEDSDRPQSSSRIQDAARAGCFQNRKFKRFCAGGLLFLLVAAVAGSVLGVVLGKQGGTSTPTNPAANPTTAPPTGYVSTWNQMGQTLVGEAAGDWFGFAAALSADATVVAGGGPLNEFSTGHIRLFSYDSASNRWKQLGQELNGNEPGDRFGSFIALSRDGNIVATGAAITDEDRTGYVRVHSFNISTNQWSQMGPDVEGRSNGDQFGSSVGLSADGAIVAVSGPDRLFTDFSYSGNKTGYVRVLAFDSTASLWTPMGQDLNGTWVGDAFGRSVALSANGTILAVGADWSDANGQDSGRVQVFAYDIGIDLWEPMGQDLVGEEAGSHFGYSVSLSKDGTILAVGSVWNEARNGSKSGHVRIFSYDLENNNWNQMGQTIDGEFERDVFGMSVTLSADGMIVAAGAGLNKGEAGEISGHVRVFSYDLATKHWSQVGQDLDGEGANDSFGFAVALSWDGSIVAAGSTWNDANGPDSGHVRVFETRESSD